MELLSLRVLIADDEVVITRSLAAILQMAGHIVKGVYSAEQAIEAAPEFIPNVLISDVMMPGMNGIQLASYLTQQYPNCRALLMSGNIAAGELIQRAQRDGTCPPILAKPVHPQQILEFLSACASSR